MAVAFSFRCFRLLLGESQHLPICTGLILSYCGHFYNMEAIFIKASQKNLGMTNIIIILNIIIEITRVIAMYYMFLSFQKPNTKSSSLHPQTIVFPSLFSFFSLPIKSLIIIIIYIFSFKPLDTW